MAQETTGERKSKHPAKRYVPQHAASAGETLHGQTDVSDALYRTLLGTDVSLQGKDPRKYNIGEIAFGSQSSFNTDEYLGKQWQVLQDAELNGGIQTGVPYIARGFVTVSGQGEAVLQTETAAIRLGRVSADVKDVLSTKLAGYEMVMPLIVDSIDNGDAEARMGEKAAYLLPNPDRWTRRRLRKIGGQAVVEGVVREVDPYERGTITVQAPGGKWFAGRKTDVLIDNTAPFYDKGTDTRPTYGEQVAMRDRVRVPVHFEGRQMSLAGDVRLLAFSQEHKKNYEAERQAIAEGLSLFESLLTEDTLQVVTTPNGKEFHVETPQAKAAVARYLFAELRQRQELLTPQQQEQLMKLVFSLPDDERPVIFEDDDTRRGELDAYFRKTGQQNDIPKLAEAMTPQQLLQEMTRIASTDAYPPPFASMIDVVNDYPGQFDREAASVLLHTTLVSREEQLRTGSNPEPAIYSLLDIMPYLRQTDTRYQTEWLAHLAYAGMTFANSNPDAMHNPHDLYEVMRQSIAGLGDLAFPERNFYGVNYDVFYTLFPYVDYIRQWPTSLPYELGSEESLRYLVRDLELMSIGRQWPQRSHVPEQQQPYSKLTEEQLEELITGLQHL